MWVEIKKCYKHIKHRISSALLPVFLFLCLLVTSILESDVTNDQVAYRIEIIATASIIAFVLLGVALAMLFLWPTNKFKWFRKNFGLLVYRGVKATENTLVGFFYMFLLMSLFFFVVYYYESQLRFVFLAVILLIFSLIIGCMHRFRILFFSPFKRMRQKPWVYAAMIPVLLVVPLLSSILAETERVVVSLNAETIREIKQSKSLDVKFQDWVKEAINEKLEKTK